MSRPTSRRASSAPVLLSALLAAAAQADIDATLQQPDLVEPLFFPLPPQPLPALPGSFAFDGAVGEWPKKPLLDTLDRRNDDPSAQAWLATDETGLTVAVRLPPGEDITLMLRIASLDRLSLPPVGWLQRFSGPHYYRSADDCALEHPENLERDNGEARCREWFAQQQPHRDAVAASFVRQWRIQASGQMQERPMLGLQPSGSIVAKTAPADAPSPSLELKLPWNAWPATDQLSLSRLYTQLSICRGSHCQILQRTGDERGVWFHTWQLEKPRQYAVACGFPLQGTWHPRVQDFSHGYFLPGDSTSVRTVFALPLPSGSYQDQPGGLSPDITSIDYAALPLSGDDEFLCGPPVSYRRGDKLHRTGMSWLAPPSQFFDIDDGNVLAVTDVIDYNTVTGMGQGGACPRRGIEAFYIDRGTGEVTVSGAEHSMDCAEEDTADYALRGPREIVATVRKCRVEDNPDAAQPAAAKADARVNVCRTEEIVHCLKPGARRFEECAQRETEVKVEP